MIKRVIVIVLLVLLWSVPFAAAQAPRSSFDPAPARHSAQQKSFIDWAFSQINARDIDYGECIEIWRQGFLNNTVQNPSFRAEVLLMAALGVLFLGYCWELRTTGALRVSTTRIVTAYASELAVARGQITRLTAEYVQARRLLEEQAEAALAAKSQKPKPASEAAAKTAAYSNNKAVEQPVDGQDNGLGQQLLDANQTIGSLRRQLSTVTKKWEEEQQKNRKLRGE